MWLGADIVTTVMQSSDPLPGALEVKLIQTVPFFKREASNEHLLCAELCRSGRRCPHGGDLVTAYMDSRATHTPQVPVTNAPEASTARSR